MKLYKYLGLFFIASLFGACSDDFIDNVTPVIPDDQALTLSFESNKMLPHQVTTRLSDPKTEQEKEIKTLHIFFFDKDGNYLEGSYLTGYPTAGENGGYCMPSVGATLLKIDRTRFTNSDAAKTATVVAVANVENGWFPLGENKRPTNVLTLDDLRKMVYRPSEIMLTIPESGMPMYGELTNQDLTSESTHALTVQLKALMARVDVNLTIDSEHSDPSGLLPMFQMADWTACNVPTGAAFYVEDEKIATGVLGENKKDMKVSNTTTLYNRNGELKLSFYMFENKQDSVEGFTYPDGIKPEEKQRYKPEFANEDAAYVQIHGLYSTYNEDGTGGSTYDVTYKLYLGANHTGNFFVKRNSQYKNNVTIKGLIQAGNNPEHVTFDTRVNVSQSNPFFVAMLRERDHDAHFCVTPMDVYMFDDTGEGDNVKMTVEVENPDVNNWIRLERVSAKEMEEGRWPSGEDKNKYVSYCDTFPGEPSRYAFHAGNGKRKYFTTAMMKAPDYDGLKSSVTLETNRDRVYVYLDENLSATTGRSANLNLVYTGADGSTINKTIKIEQTHLIAVTLKGDSPYFSGDRTVYMERYEEYLDHYDPLDEFETTQIYPGLPWGLTGLSMQEQEIYNADYNPDNVGSIYYDGLKYTPHLVYLAGHSENNLNGKPRSAAEYCYNKNKRNESGTITFTTHRSAILNRLYVDKNDSKWYLPGIREMEKAFEQQYNTFPEFQGNFYWSVSPGKYTQRVGFIDVTYYPADRARATNIRSNGTHAESGDDEYDYPTNGGYAYRTQILRIRAFRTDLEPANY